MGAAGVCSLSSPSDIRALERGRGPRDFFFFPDVSCTSIGPTSASLMVGVRIAGELSTDVLTTLDATFVKHFVIRDIFFEACRAFSLWSKKCDRYFSSFSVIFSTSVVSKSDSLDDDDMSSESTATGFSTLSLSLHCTLRAGTCTIGSAVCMGLLTGVEIAIVLRIFCNAWCCISKLSNALANRASFIGRSAFGRDGTGAASTTGRDSTTGRS